MKRCRGWSLQVFRQQPQSFDVDLAVVLHRPPIPHLGGTMNDDVRFEDRLANDLGGAGPGQFGAVQRDAPFFQVGTIAAGPNDGADRPILAPASLRNVSADEARGTCDEIAHGNQCSVFSVQFSVFRSEN